MAVNRLDVIKLQSSSTGTGHTRIGGTRRSLLVDQEVFLLICVDV